MTDARDKVIERLEQENDELRARVAALEEELSWAGFTFPVEWCLTPKEGKVLAALSARAVCSKEYLHSCIYSTNIDGGAELKIIDVFVCKIRRKLKDASAAVTISTVWGNGYTLNAASRAAVASYMQKRAA